MFKGFIFIKQTCYNTVSRFFYLIHYFKLYNLHYKISVLQDHVYSLLIKVLGVL